MAESNNLVLKKISDIAGFKFFIPSFQRGYRWDIMQVEDLLNDIKEYIDIENKESFLCLQPIVVYEKKNKDDKQNENQNEKDKTFVVIDGQQRLTAIAIIKYYLNMNYSYSIEYEKNGTKLGILLENIKYNINDLKDKIHTEVYNNIKNRQTRSLDEYHIILSYLTIVRYFNELNDKDKYIKEFKKLFESKNDNNSIQFIWYNVTDEIQDDEKKAIEIFTRLNIGKIQLTDAELIKALFLKKDNFKESEIDKKLHIAYKWDEIEKTLNNDTFWYFISNKNEDEIKKRNRIELILELAIDTQNGKNHELFKEYENRLKENNKLDELWQKIEECFMTLKEWYNDNEMYHYVGFLTCNKKYIKDIYKNLNNYNNDDNNNDNKPINKIKKMVLDVLDYNKKQDTTEYITQLEYGSSKISKLLFFSNIYTTIKMNMKKNSKEDTNNNLLNRFPFDLYVKESWDIEHISPQTDSPLNSNKERIIWFIESYKYLKINFSDEDFKKFIQENNLDDEKSNTLYLNLQKNKIENLITLYDKQKDTIKSNDIKNIIFEDENWNLIYAYMFDYAERNYKDFLLTDDEKNKLGNLVLLPSDINRAYKNALFGVKRKHIIDDEQNNRFIPIDTKHVFLKYYSNNTIDLWVQDDLNDYINIIIGNINQFFENIKGA